MILLKNRNIGAILAFLTLIGIIGLLPVEFLISALLFALVVRGGLYLIHLAIASDPKAKEFDNN